MHLSLWACVCGTHVVGHSCSAELAAKGKSTPTSSPQNANKILKTEFEHLGHGGAEMLNETYDLMMR